MLKESFLMSLQNIRSNKMRSFLTILGIVIGVAAVISLITIVDGVTTNVNQQFSSMGTGKLTVQAKGTSTLPGLSLDMIKEMADVQGVDGVSVSTSFTATAAYKTTLLEEAAIEGKDALYFQENANIPSQGRPLYEMDIENDSYVCVLNSNAQTALFGTADPIGEAVTVNGVRFTVIGVTDSAASPDVLADAKGEKDKSMVMIPYTVAMKLKHQNYLNNARVMVKDSKNSDIVSSLMEKYLKKRFLDQDGSFSIINMKGLLSSLDSIMELMTGLLAGIASISLLVGGIGIMNMMLVSVTERTTEIGLRKALGAKPRYIQTQFILESVLLSMLGGIIGVALGLTISYIFSIVMKLDFQISAYAVFLGVIFSTAVGILFGWMPARKASRLNPIEALRSM